MKTNILLVIFIAFIFIFQSCGERYIPGNTNETIGLNGDFEDVKNGFPLNWNIHSSPINKGHSKIILDTVDVKNGTYSLKIQADKVAGSSKTWNKPGLNKEIPIKPYKKYNLSVWVKNSNCEFYVKWITSDKANKKQHRSRSFIETDITFKTWYYFREIISTNEDEDLLRLEIIVTKPGTLWIDNLKFEEITEDSLQQNM